jgi:DNA-binding MarR family transcriptional regulator
MTGMSVRTKGAVEPSDLTDADYVRLLHLRDGLRRFQRWSEQLAIEAGVTPAHHQLLLVVKGHGGSEGPTIGDVADHLLLKHHSAVELVDRCERAGLATREHDAGDHRRVLVSLTAAGEDVLRRLSEVHEDELTSLAPHLIGALEAIVGEKA